MTTLDYTDILQIDIHSHLLPHVDHGAESEDEAFSMISQMAEMGYRHLVLTPHCRQSLFTYNPKSIKTVFQQVKKRVATEGLDINLSLGAEYFFGHYLNQMLADRDMFFLDQEQRCFLLELPVLMFPPTLPDWIFKAKVKGFKLVIAHPERYEFVIKNPLRVTQLLDLGVYLQMNLGSCLGLYGRKVKKTALTLLGNGLVQLMGSDLHSPSELKTIRKGIKKIVKKFGREYISTLCSLNPGRLLAGEELIM